jgi:hypothetical protein
MDGWIVSGRVALLHAGHKPNVHHGFIFDITITYFVFVLGSWPKQFSVLHVFWLRQSEATAVVYSRDMILFIVSNCSPIPKMCILCIYGGQI